MYEKAYGCRKPFLTLPDTLGNSGVYYNDLNNDNLGMWVSGNANDSVDFYMTSQTDVVPMIFQHTADGSNIDNVFVYFTSDNPGANISIADSTFSVTGYANGLYKIDNLFNADSFDLVISLDSCITDSFGVTAHFGYTCNDANFADLQTQFNLLTGQPEPDLLHWNICSPDTQYTIIVHALSPHYIIAATPDTATIDSCLCLTYLINATNTSLYVEGDSVSLYVVPPTGFVYDTAHSYVNVIVAGDTTTFPLGYPTGYQFIDTLNALASYWNIDSIGVTVPFLLGVNLDFVLVFHPNPCPLDTSLDYEVASVLLGYTPCLEQSFSQPKFPQIDDFVFSNFCCTPTDSMLASIEYYFGNCADSCSATVTASVTGGNGTYYYNWSNGASFNPLTNVCPGSYSVIIHDGTGAIAFDTINVNYFGGAIVDTLISAATHSLCDTSIIHLTVASGYSYKWYWNGIGIPASNHSYYNDSVGGSFTCKIWNACDTVFTNQFLVATCCNGIVPDTIFSANDTAAAISLNETEKIIQIIRVGSNPTLHLIASNSFSGCQVIVEPNVSFEFEPSSSIRITNSATIQTSIHGCGYLWNGMFAPYSDDAIYCSGDSTMGNVLIEDSKKGFVSDTGALIQTHLTTFDRNIVGMLVHNQIMLGANPLSVTATKFTCSSSPLLPDYFSGDTLHRGSAGIRIRDVWDTTGYVFSGVTVGDTINSTNEFYNLDTCIDSRRANLTVLNNYFHYDTLDITGKGILFSGLGGGSHPYYLNVGVGISPDSVGLSYYNSFHNCENAILLERLYAHSTIRIYFNQIDTSTTGIFVRNTDHLDCGIISNSFSDFKNRGILFGGSNTHTAVKVSANTMINPSNNDFHLNNYGIYLDQNGANNSDSYAHVANNTVTGVRNGIFLRNYLNSSEVLNNSEIRFGINSAPQFGRGIWVENCFGVRVIDNHIWGNSGATNHNRGIVAKSSDKFYIEGNSIDTSGRAIYMVNTSEECNIVCNSFNHCKKGAVVFDNFIPIAPINIATDQCDSIPQPSDNHWYGMSNSDRRLEVLNFTVGSNIHWYHRTTPASDNISGVQNYHDFSSLTAIDTIAISSAPTSCCGSRTAERRDTCYTEPEICRETSIGEIVDDSTLTEEQIQDSLLWTLAKYYATRYAYDQLMRDSIWLNLGTDEDLIYQMFYDSVTLTNIALLREIKEALLAHDTVLANSLNELIVAANIPEQNFKIVNAIYFAAMEEQRDTFTTDEYQALEQIANSNSFMGGPAVFSARALLLLAIDPEPEIYQFRKENDELIENHFGNFVPNPSGDLISLNYTITNSNDYILCINDLTGKLIISKSLDDELKEIKIDISKFHSGLYLFTISSNGINVKNGKIVIIH